MAARKKMPQTARDYDPEPCPHCGSTRVRELGQYLNGPCITIIYCQDCGHKVQEEETAGRTWTERQAILRSQQKARERWAGMAEPLFPQEDSLARGLLEE